MNNKKGGIIGKLLAALLVILAAAFVVLLYYTEILPLKYLILIGAGLLILVAVTAILLWNVSHKVRFLFGIFLWIILLAAMALGTLYIYRTRLTLTELTSVDTEISQVGIYVRSGDEAETVEDTAEYTYGILEELDLENTQAALQQVNESLGREVKTKTYRGLGDLVDGLLRGETNAILLNTAYLDIISEMDGYYDLDKNVSELAVKNVESAIEVAESTASGQAEAVEAVPPKEESGKTAEEETEKDEKKETEEKKQEKQNSVQNKNVYTIYVSGIDNRGGIVARSRSDVNIIITANLDTHQMLLVSTPRDYFVPLSISNGIPDKLTHAGIYGISVCMDTLGMLYDIPISYYVRMNFGGFVDIIDALGGITVNCDYDFTAQNGGGGYHFVKGENHLSGEEALSFARERYAFAEGDRQRGKNQMAVIKGVLNKLISTDLLSNYSSVLSNLQGCFETNISYEEIARVVQSQLNNLGDWNVVSYSVDGTGDTQKPYSMSQNAYVMVPDMSTVEHAKELMAKVRNGEILE